MREATVASLAAMRVYVSDSSCLPALIGYLEEHLDAITARLGENEFEVSLLGSQRIDAMRTELELRVATWRAAHPGVDVVVA